MEDCWIVDGQPDGKRDIGGILKAAVDDAGVRCDVGSVPWSRENGSVDAEVGGVGKLLFQGLGICKIESRKETEDLRFRRRV